MCDRREAGSGEGGGEGRAVGRGGVGAILLRNSSCVRCSINHLRLKVPPDLSAVLGGHWLGLLLASENSPSLCQENSSRTREPPAQGALACAAGPKMQEVPAPGPPSTRRGLAPGSPSAGPPVLPHCLWAGQASPAAAPQLSGLTLRCLRPRHFLWLLSEVTPLCPSVSFPHVPSA